MSKILHESKLPLTRKTIVFRIYQNKDGAFVAIIEANGRNKSTVFIPAEDYYAFLEAAHDITLEVSRIAKLPF